MTIATATDTDDDTAAAAPAAQPVAAATQPPEAANRDTLWVEPWDDPITDPLGHDPVSQYAELFWLPVLGPSSLWLLRRVSLMLQDSPSGFSVKMCDLAHEIGLGQLARAAFAVSEGSGQMLRLSASRSPRRELRVCAPSHARSRQTARASSPPATAGAA